MLQFPPPERFIEVIRSRIAEAMGFGPYDFRPVAIPLIAPMSTTVLQATAFYTIPRVYKFRLTRLRPIICPVDAPDEGPTSDSDIFGIYQPRVNTFVMQGGQISDHLLAKAHNCRFDLKLNNGNFNLNPVPSMSLADLWKDNRWSAFDTPLSLPPGSNIQLTMGLQDTSALAVGGETNYGVMMVGQLVRYQP